MMAEQTKQTAVQLVQAAEQLGIRPEALRMRIKRGKADGFKRNGRWHVYVNTAPKQLNKPTEQRSDADQTDDTDFDRVAEAFALDMRRQIRRLEVQNDTQQAELRDMRQQHADQVRQMQDSRDELERRLTTLMQQQQQQLADLNERLALPSPEDVNEKRHTRAVLAGIVDVLGRLYRRGG